VIQDQVPIFSEKKGVWFFRFDVRIFDTLELGQLRNAAKKLISDMTRAPSIQRNRSLKEGALFLYSFSS